MNHIIYNSLYKKLYICTSLIGMYNSDRNEDIMKNQTSSKHALLSEWIKNRIEEGTYIEGCKIPSENELALQFNYSRQTVRQSIGTLVSEGILTREQGSGTYVAKRKLNIKTEKTMRIGVITTYFDDYIFPSIIHGIDEILTASGYTLSLGITHNKPADEEKCLRQMLQTGVDGIIIEGTKSALPNSNAHLYEEIESHNIPIVFINGFYGNDCPSYVVMDDVKSGILATEHLLKNGHTRIGGILKSDDIQGIRRYEGMVQTLKEHQLPLDDTSVIWYTTEDLKYLFSGTMDTIILERFSNVSSVICYNDQIAAQFIGLLKRNNMNVPDDISILSFDNSFLSKEMVYNLTSVIHPSKKIGKKAASLMLSHINKVVSKDKIKMEPTLKIRGSVKSLS